jgi:hypothetical protein
VSSWAGANLMSEAVCTGDDVAEVMLQLARSFKWK